MRPSERELAELAITFDGHGAFGDVHHAVAAGQQRAEQAARRDVAGLSALQVDNQPRGRANARAALPDDPGKRVTADGSRYFVGALLPSGHRVMHIAERAVTIERHGQLSKLTL